MESPASADQYLIEQVRAGDSAAWRQLIDRFSGRLLAFARSRTASVSDAEDLVQETLIGFLQSLTHFDASRSLETYLFTILRYKLYDLLRQKKLPIVTAPAESEDWWDRAIPGSTETPSRHIADEEAAASQEQILGSVLRKLIADLRDRQAFVDLQVIELLFYAGMRNLEVGELMDIDQKAVAGIKFRAIQKLQSFLSDTGPALAELAETNADVTVARVWREQRLTCLKRGTLGSYALGLLEDPWKSYTQFHLDVVGCPMCVANLADLQSEEEPAAPVDMERMFQSSVGFLSRPN
ncbi:MAG: sigma-70 family RNA polymerase sigma factor [Planctomycetes bacterium]|nr:sigma-70 family RNA polymerase sigma factor [Planctomycetota bacterium]MBI3835093.1 sigma-70 family RNA polymerase sigma factor [Planctomycetota bacterium]